MRVGIAGAGAIAMGYSAMLLGRGHSAGVWSPSGGRTGDLLAGKPLTVAGAIEGEFHPDVYVSVTDLARVDVIILALPANGHRDVIDAIVPFIEPRHTVIFSGHLSFAGLYLKKCLAGRGIEIPIVVWNTTALTCKAQAFNQVRVGTLRKTVSIAVEPARMAERGLAICIELFGERFSLEDDMLTITLSNLNPQSHLAIALCNLTRFERGENWGQRENITNVVGRLIEALDRERCVLATALGKRVGTVFDHYENAFGIVGHSVAGMSAEQLRRGSDIAGPKTIDSRYVLEDVPFGLVPLQYLADIAGVDLPLHRSGILILNACYDRSFSLENNLLPTIAASDIKGFLAS